MAGFTESMINERVQAFWAALQRGEFIIDAGWRDRTGSCGSPRFCIT